MNNPGSRKTVAIGVIALSITAGAWMVLVEPARGPLAAAKAEEQRLSGSVSQAESIGNDIARLVERVTRAKTRQRQVEQRALVAANERELTASLMSMAAAHNIRIDQIKPMDATAHPKAPAGGAEDPAAKNDRAAGFAITTVAAYGDLVAFLGAIRTQLGYTLVRSVRLVPSTEPGSLTVVAEIRTEHLAPALANAQPAAGGH